MKAFLAVLTFLVSTMGLAATHVDVPMPMQVAGVLSSPKYLKLLESLQAVKTDLRIKYVSYAVYEGDRSRVVIGLTSPSMSDKCGLPVFGEIEARGYFNPETISYLRVQEIRFLENHDDPCGARSR